jgi:hypothetical protein
MNLRQAFTASVLLSLTAPVLVPAAHAQTIGWMDRLFTFREDQKPLVSGNRRNLGPNYVMQPSYNPNDHVAWSQFYTQPDLQAQDALVGSASKVMRTPMPLQMAQAQTQGHSQGGFGAIADRALENAREERPLNIQIGEPGEGMGMQSGASQVGRGTQVGAPRNDWRDKADPRMSSRPGDYDFEGANRARGETLTETAPKFNLPVIGPAESSAPNTMVAGDEVYTQYNAQGQAVRYRVQRGDTLGSIAAQPKIYNDTRLWPLIYTANRNAIGRSPNRIAPKMELTIPRDYTPEQAKAARQRSR